MEEIGKTNSELPPTEFYHHCNKQLDNAKDEILSRWDDFLSKYDEQDVVTQMYLQEVAMNLGIDDLDMFIRNHGYIKFKNFFPKDDVSAKKRILTGMMVDAFRNVLSHPFAREKAEIFSSLDHDMHAKVSEVIATNHPNWEQEIMEESFMRPRLFSLEKGVKNRVSLHSPSALFVKNSSSELQNAVAEGFNAPYDDVRRTALMVNWTCFYFKDVVHFHVFALK